MTDEQPAGWFPDPGTRHEYRYWDGDTWTDQVSDRGAVAVDELGAPQPVPTAPSTQAAASPGTAPATAPSATRRSGRGGIIALGVVAGLLFVVGIVGFVVSSAASSDKDDYREEQAALDAQGLEAGPATDAIDKAQADVDAALEEFRAATQNVVTTGNQVSDAFDTALCGTSSSTPGLPSLPCFGQITAEEAAGIAPVADQYSAAVDAQSAAYLKFVGASSALETALQGAPAEGAQQ